MAQVARTPVMLNSWKEIAAYLDRGIRTVQRWERELHLPVHRIGTGKRSPVYATIHELNFWISTSGAVRAKLPQPHEPPPLSRRSNRPLEESRRLLSTFRELVQIVAENSVRQQQQAEMLRTRILQMRAQMK